MKNFLLIILILFVHFSCNEEDPKAITKDGPFAISELSGTYEATKAQFSVNTVSVDLVEEGGTATLSIQNSGRFTLTLAPQDRTSYTVSGEMFWEAWQGTYFFAISWDDEPGDWDTYGHTWDGTRLTINGGADTGEYDFDNDGYMESCSLHFIFVRS